MNIKISTDQSLLDIDLIHDYLSNQSYRAEGRSKELVEKSIKNSFCFGVYQDGNQVGFAKVVTDFTLFAWLLDVFILPEVQGKGLGKKLMESIIAHPKLQTIQRWGLNTKDAQGLYEQYGFKIPEDIEMYMERLNKK